MAEAAKKAFWEIVKEALVALGMDVAFKEFTKKGLQVAAATVGDKITNDQRAELLDDLRKMPAEDTANIWRRHREAIANLEENRFVSLLCKLCEDEGADKLGRRPALKWLNDQTDEKFDQALYMLEHDVPLQWLKKIRREGGRIAEKDLGEIREFFAINAPDN